MSRFGVLRLRDLRYVFGSSLVSQLGDGIVTVCLAFAVLDLTHSPTDLGVVIALRTVAQVAALLVGGVVADRVSRRAVMMGADVVRFFGQGAIGVLLVAGHPSVVVIALSQLVLGAAGGFFNPAASGLMPAVAGEHLQQANALNGIAGAASGILGPALGGVVVVAVGPAWGLVGDAFSYAGSALMLSFVSASVARRVGTGGNSFLTDMRGGFKEVSSRQWVWTLIIVFAVGNALAGTWEVYGPLVCRRHYGGAAAFALLSAMWGVGSVLGGLILLRWKPSRPLRAGVILCIPFTFGSILLAVGAPLPVVIPFTIFSGLAPISFNTLWWTALQTRVPPEAISRVISYDFAGSFALQPVAYALAGPLVTLLGLTAAMIGCALVASGVVGSALFVRDVRDLENMPGNVPAETGIVTT